ncbi:MAG TPA: magnesium/cobalt transporter CorA [Ktedonosporobacter sp.]|nr:magnesium/cobalt transporter CorA [Ktedonosporobacter sp.]
MQQQVQSQQDMPAQPREVVVVWQNGHSRTENLSEALHEVVNDPHALTWLDIVGDCSEQEELLCNVFSLAPITIQTMCEDKERAKFNEQEHYFYLVVHGISFDTQSNEANTPKLDIVFGKNFVITAHREALPWLDALLDDARKKSSDEHLMGRGMAFLLYELLDGLVDSYFPVLDDLDELIDDLEDETVNSTSNDVQIRIFRIKRSLAELRRVISPQVEVFTSLVARTGKMIPAKAEPYFADVRDHLIRAFEVLDSYRDLMSGMLDVYLTTVSNRLNVVMKQLTIIATIFMPITFITGVFGQNFGHLPQVEHDNGYLFWIVLAAMVLLTVLQIWYFRRRGWM